ncbi:hypothetical protein DOTSEDRAFT_71401 [Dothistroma septosporum NZE10]|uniref:Uncharacterized protein n=1 Tax=Dothistroma septosporum (strain NZE10 / CBS 128990) TaxID=675120 RepID=N1PTK4_DOTSN|nr:hypothetical protein DOTSEDRAFT_71401 [Dothistroma septosporum NZE10]
MTQRPSRHNVTMPDAYLRCPSSCPACVEAVMPMRSAARLRRRHREALFALETEVKESSEPQGINPPRGIP